MNIDQGRLSFAANIDNAQLRSDAEESRNILAGIGQTAQQESNRMNAAFGRMAAAAGSFFAIGQIKDFARQIISVRSEIESLEISFETLAGKEKGNALFKDIKDFATSTPMMMKDLASGAQTMLAFNIEAEKVMPMLKAIGDISMGDAQKFNSLALSFSQMSATGKLMGQDLLQMINAGFNPLSVISEKTGKSIGELKEEMEKGKISTDMVTDAFITATSAGGKFYNMLEKQSHGTAGAISNLQGAIDDMFNDLGAAAQGATVKAIGGATDIVKHYREIGEILAVIVAAYGTYRAAIIATEAVRRSVTAIKHTDEAAQIYAVMSAEQKARISKLGLAQTSEAYRAAVIAEMKTEMNRQIQIAQTAQVELTAARERLVTAETAKAAAAEKVASCKAEVTAAYTSAAAEQKSSLLKKIAAESEAQSRSALLAVKLQEQKNAAIAQVKSLKEAGASQEVIAAKNREIATISNKIAVAKAEEVQHSRNVVALRREMTAQVDATASKKIASAETALETAQEELNSASKARNTAAREVNSKAAVVNTAVKRAGRIETTLDTAAETANANATGFLSAAKTKLTAVTARLNAVVMKNPWAIVAAAVVALAYGMYKLMNSETEAEKKFNDATEELNEKLEQQRQELKELNKERNVTEDMHKEAAQAVAGEIDKIETLKSAIHDETASLQDRRKAIKELQAIVPGYNATLSNEGVLYENNTKAVEDYIASLENLAIAKALQSKRESLQADKLAAELERREAIKDRAKAQKEAEAARKRAAQDRKKSEEQQRREVSASLAVGGTAGHTMAVADNSMATKREKEIKAEEDYYNKKLKEQQQRVKILDEKIANAEEDLDVLKDYQKENNIKPVKSTSTSAGTASGKSKTGKGKNTEDEAERLKREAQERQKALDEYTSTLAEQNEEAELDLRQQRLNLAEDSTKKELDQIRLNYDRMLHENEKRRKEMYDKLAEKKITEYMNEHPKAKQSEINEYAAGLKLTDKDLSEEQRKQLAGYAALAKEYLTKSNKAALDKMLSDVLTYEQQRTKITEEYTRKRNDLYEKNEDGSIKTDADGNKVLRKGVTQGNLDELKRQEDEALKSVDQQFASREETYQAWCESIANLSLHQLEDVLAKAKHELDEMKKNNPNDPNLAVARAKVNKAEEDVRKARAKEYMNPGARSIKEWEDLYKTLNDVEKEFESLGDTIGGVVGDIISACGSVATSSLQMINGIVQLTQWSLRAEELAAQGASKAVQQVEKASVILTIITSALQISMQIASLFNNDGAKQKEIESLQERIDQLQWELDNQDIGSIQQQYGSAMERVNEALRQTRVELAAGQTGWQGWLTLMSKASDNQELMRKSAERLAKVYGSMSYTIGKALGEDKYKSAGDQLKNLAEQQILIQEQIEAERSRKKSDSGKIQEWEHQLEELGRKSIEVINGMVEDIIGDSSTGIAGELADAFIEAFKAGEDAAEKWGDKVNDIVADILKRMLVSKFLEEPLGEIFNRYKAKWFKDGEFQGLQNVIDSMQGFADDLNAVGADFAAIWDSLPDSVKNMFTMTSDAEREASQKGIATASQESVDELNGRMTAVQGHTFSIAENIKTILGITQMILQSVMNIEGETAGFGARLERMESSVANMSNTLDDMATRGLKIRT